MSLFLPSMDTTNNMTPGSSLVICCIRLQEGVWHDGGETVNIFFWDKRKKKHWCDLWLTHDSRFTWAHGWLVHIMLHPFSTTHLDKINLED